jgi:hypothetical protein
MAKTKRRTFRRTNKKRQRGRGFFTEKTLEDNKRNCRAYWDNNRSERDRLCSDEKHLLNRSYPGRLNRLMGNKYGTEIGTSTVGSINQ